DLPVLLVGDVDRGGVIASIVGTHVLLPENERARLVGYVINKFRGDIRLFDGALDAIGERTGLRAFGVIPYLEAARRLPREDAASLGSGDGSRTGGSVVIAVPRLSRIANFDDLDPLIAEPDVDLRIIEPGNAMPGDARVILIPGSKATAADLAFLRAQGWDVDIKAHLRRGGLVVGLCGGYQMLGRVVHDFDGIEGTPGSVMGLGLLDVETTITGNKTLREVTGVELASGLPIHGYEMHVGVTEGPGRAYEWLELDVCDGDEDVRPEGAVSADGRVMGSYLHGLFRSDAFRAEFLRRLNPERQGGLAFDAQVDAALDALADHVEAFVDLDGLLETAKGWRSP
ncbi:MAG: cobyric acid synthase, partial [Rhodospirillales bacterium]|nr:cobyric acid synthase [Rhodospirillales bacterium]